MKTSKNLKISSYIIMALGIIHTCATPVIFNLKDLKNSEPGASVYMFVVVGFATIFVGWLQYYCIKKIKIDSAFNKILGISIKFLLVMGIGAVIAMRDNPFAYIILVTAIYEWALRKRLTI